MSEVDPWLDLALVPSPLSVLPRCHKLLCSSMYTPNHDASPTHGPQITSQQCTKIAELGATIQSLIFLRILVTGIKVRTNILSCVNTKKLTTHNCLLTTKRKKEHSRLRVLGADKLN